MSLNSAILIGQSALTASQIGLQIAGNNLANPSSLIGSAAMLLAWLGERRGDDRLTRAAQAIEAALDRVIATADGRTADMGGRLGTDAFGARVAGAVE